MIELLAAMTVMLIGIFAIFGVFQAGIVQIRRASTVTTAAALADSEMEKFRAIKYDSIGLANTAVDTVVAGSYGSTYTGQSFYLTDTAASTTLSAAITTTSQTSVPVQSTITGFPSSGPFLVKIDSEYMLVNNRSTSTWSLYRTADRACSGRPPRRTPRARRSTGSNGERDGVRQLAVHERSPDEDRDRRRRALLQGRHVHHLEADHQLRLDRGPARQAREHRRPGERLRTGHGPRSAPRSTRHRPIATAWSRRSPRKALRLRTCAPREAEAATAFSARHEEDAEGTPDDEAAMSWTDRASMTPASSCC